MDKVKDRVLLVGGRYKIGKKLGAGNFGEIRIGKDVMTNEHVAIKLELVSAKKHRLNLEFHAYKQLTGGEGMPKCFYYGHLGSKYNALVIELLGPSLNDLFFLCNKRFSLKTVLMIANQLISRLEFIHNKNFVYRDIKPDNFVIGRMKYGKEATIYMIDMGLVTEYIVPGTKDHIAPVRNRTIVGTVRYMSINSHMGREQSRRDDLESLGYLLIYFLKGFLPWQGIKGDTAKERYRKIGKIKEDINVAKLCEGAPAEMMSYMTYCKELGFTDKPDYVYLRKIFTDLYDQSGYAYDNVYDWSSEMSKLWESKNHHTKLRAEAKDSKSINKSSE